MEHSVHSLLIRLSPERRREDRRARVDELVLALREAFGPSEREGFRCLDRRISLRRQGDMPNRTPRESPPTRERDWA